MRRELSVDRTAPRGSRVQAMRLASGERWRACTCKGGKGGAYHLVLYLSEGRRLHVGSLGEKTFRAGYYVYTGSVISGIDARVRRHLGNRRRRHWHIDYLLEVATVVRVIRVPSEAREECARNAAVSVLPGAQPAKGFGASDCHCASHLYYFPVEPAIA